MGVRSEGAHCDVSFGVAEYSQGGAAEKVVEAAPRFFARGGKQLGKVGLHAGGESVVILVEGGKGVRAKKRRQEKKRGEWLMKATHDVNNAEVAQAD